MLKYRVFRPGAGVVSWHRTEAGANRSLARQIKGSAQQGGYNQDRVQTYLGGDWWPRPVQDKNLGGFVWMEHSMTREERRTLLLQTWNWAELRGVSE